MRSFMDEVTFNAKGNEVTLVKRRGPRKGVAGPWRSRTLAGNKPPELCGTP